MKPLLKSVQLTEDDMAILKRRGRPYPYARWTLCLETDRRDAELMLNLAVMKQQATWERRCPGLVIHIAWAFAGLECEIKEAFA